MPKKTFNRTDRLAEDISRRLSILIQKEAQDPAIGQITITRVVLSRDLAYAKIYFLPLTDEGTGKELEGLGRATGFLRSSLASSMTIRSVPKLTFIIDEDERKGKKLRTLIESLPDNKKNDATDSPA